MKKLLFTLILVSSFSLVSSASISLVSNTVIDKIVIQVKQQTTTPKLIFSKDKDVRCRVDWSSGGSSYSTGWYDTCAQAESVYNTWASQNGRPPMQK
jgi:hypothetical protein